MDNKNSPKSKNSSYCVISVDVKVKSFFELKKISANVLDNCNFVTCQINY